jgi:hypothetical protein
VSENGTNHMPSGKKERIYFTSILKSLETNVALEHLVMSYPGLLLNIKYI